MMTLSAFVPTLYWTAAVKSVLETKTQTLPAMPPSGGEEPPRLTAVEQTGKSSKNRGKVGIWGDSGNKKKERNLPTGYTVDDQQSKHF